MAKNPSKLRERKQKRRDEAIVRNEKFQNLSVDEKKKINPKKVYQ